MKSMVKLFGIIAAAALTGFSMAGCENAADGGTGGQSSFVPVTNITGVKPSVTVGTVTLSGTVVPSDATNKTIIWSVQSPGDAEGTISGNRLTTLTEGYVRIMATVRNGKAEGENYTKPFTISVDRFVAVTYILGVPVSGEAGEELILYGDVYPEDATYTDIVWSVKDAGTTRAAIKGDVLTTRAEGTVIVSATVINGTAEGTDYTADFFIFISDL